MLIQKIHHVAYRCKDAKETVEWYGKHLDMKFVLAIAENQVPSTKAPDPYMHIFLDAGNGNVLAFFELPGQPLQQLPALRPSHRRHVRGRDRGVPPLGERHLLLVVTRPFGHIGHHIAKW